MPDIDIQLTPAPLDLPAATARVTDPDAGGINIFLGTTRAETDPARGQLLALEYHAYEEMALKQLHALADQACAQWPIAKLVLWHRLGTVPVGQPSVLIAVSTPHRAESFDACEFLIDSLKKSAPIWKKELYQHDSLWQAER